MGFRRKSSSESALLKLSNILFSAKHQKKSSYLVTIDFPRAFNCINFNKMAIALHKCSVSEHAKN